jgi:hypothetical protein
MILAKWFFCKYFMHLNAYLPIATNVVWNCDCVILYQGYHTNHLKLGRPELASVIFFYDIKSVILMSADLVSFWKADKNSEKNETMSKLEKNSNHLKSLISLNLRLMTYRTSKFYPTSKVLILLSHKMKTVFAWNWGRHL